MLHLPARPPSRLRRFGVTGPDTNPHARSKAVAVSLARSVIPQTFVADVAGVHLWTIACSAPVALAVLALFVPAFRSLAVWIGLTFLYVVLVLPPLRLFEVSIITEAQMWALVSAAGFVYQASIGLQLRRGAESLEVSARTRHKLAPQQLHHVPTARAGIQFFLRIGSRHACRAHRRNAQELTNHRHGVGGELAAACAGPGTGIVLQR